jgi:hypothetical protein
MSRLNTKGIDEGTEGWRREERGGREGGWRRDREGEGEKV